MTSFADVGTAPDCHGPSLCPRAAVVQRASLAMDDRRQLGDLVRVQVESPSHFSGRMVSNTSTAEVLGSHAHDIHGLPSSSFVTAHL